MRTIVSICIIKTWTNDFSHAGESFHPFTCSDPPQSGDSGGGGTVRAIFKPINSLRLWDCVWKGLEGVRVPKLPMVSSQSSDTNFLYRKTLMHRLILHCVYVGGCVRAFRGLLMHQCNQEHPQTHTRKQLHAFYSKMLLQIFCCIMLQPSDTPLCPCYCLKWYNLLLLLLLLDSTCMFSSCPIKSEDVHMCVHASMFGAENKKWDLTLTADTEEEVEEEEECEVGRVLRALPGFTNLWCYF